MLTSPPFMSADPRPMNLAVAALGFELRLALRGNDVEVVLTATSRCRSSAISPARGSSQAWTSSARSVTELLLSSAQRERSKARASAGRLLERHSIRITQMRLELAEQAHQSVSLSFGQGRHHLGLGRKEL